MPSRCVMTAVSDLSGELTCCAEVVSVTFNTNMHNREILENSLFIRFLFFLQKYGNAKSIDLESV